MTLIHILNANAERIPLADGSVQCIATSPPYFGLRDYGIGGQIGLESTPAAYVARLVTVFRECWRVLRDDGVMFVNLGDSYARDEAKGGSGTFNGRNGRGENYRGAGLSGAKQKDLLGIPWRVAFALQDDGWYLRSDIIWHKPNPMPESVTDRPTKAHEYVFLLTKSPRYFWDAAAVAEKAATIADGRAKKYTSKINAATIPNRNDNGGRVSIGFPPAESGRNLRTVWTVATQPYSGAHFATWPEKLVEPMVKAGTSERGACPQCGAAWVRVVERTATNHKERQDRQTATGGAITGGVGKNFPDVSLSTIGFRPACECNAGEPVPCVVLDPFAGSGTTLRVAARLGRRAFGLDLNMKYLQANAKERTATIQMEMPA